MENIGDTLMTFDKALIELKNGKRLTRRCWGDKGGAKITLEFYKGTTSFLCELEDNEKTFWRIETRDILADDWVVV